METIRNILVGAVMEIKYIKRKCKRKRIRIIKLLVMTLLLCVIVNLLLKTRLSPPFKAGERNMIVKLQYVAVHLDLKGAPPTLDYLKSVLKRLKDLGANALLIEYEDMFPYTDTIVNISSPNHYNPDKLLEFLTIASNLGFEIIPLIQTFGHLEFVLKLNQYKDLREDSNLLDSICPSKEASLQLIRDMLTQVITFHSKISPVKHFHIGCDEVFMNVCEVCQRRRMNNMEIYLDHVIAVHDIVQAISPGTVVLIWDDMLRSTEPTKWQLVPKMDTIELVCWDYTPKSNQIKHSVLRFYHQHFQNLWIATAFKGADGKKTVIPILGERVTNHYMWMKVIENYRFGGEDQEFTFKGIALTGWSRYSHFSPLCDLLPLSLPSLFANLLVVKRFRDGIIGDYYSEYDLDQFMYNLVISDLETHLKCTHLEGDWRKRDFSSCRDELIYPMFDHIQKYREKVAEIMKELNTQNYVYRTRKFSLQSIEQLERDLEVAEHEAKSCMNMFDQNVIAEYIGLPKNSALALLNHRKQQIKSPL